MEAHTYKRQKLEVSCGGGGRGSGRGQGLWMHDGRYGSGRGGQDMTKYRIFCGTRVLYD